MTIKKQAQQARQASFELMALDGKIKDNALRAIAAALQSQKEKIIAVNEKDRDAAHSLSKPLLKRLTIDKTKINEMIRMVESVAQLDDPCNKVLETIELDTELILEKVSVPIGVIGMIFESRPDALVQIASLALKSGNAAILKGGSEAKQTNQFLAQLIQEASQKAGIPNGWLQLIETREQVQAMLALHDSIDLIIPRGSNEFVHYVMQHTKIPVLSHASGVCTIYVDKDADIEQSANVCYDAKVQYPTVCNAIENLLVHKSIAKQFLGKMVPKYLQAGVELRCDSQSYAMVRALSKKNNQIKKATSKDWTTEYNDLILSIKLVNDTAEAIRFINMNGSHHTDAILTTDKGAAEQFLNAIDSSSVLWNCSTRFADGFRYGKGAEVGISTAKIHARGPVGLDGLLIYKYKLRGNGHVVRDYTGVNAKQFTHKKIT